MFLFAQKKVCYCIIKCLALLGVSMILGAVAVNPEYVFEVGELKFWIEKISNLIKEIDAHKKGFKSVAIFGISLIVVLLHIIDAIRKLITEQNEKERLLSGLARAFCNDLKTKLESKYGIADDLRISLYIEARNKKEFVIFHRISCDAKYESGGRSRVKQGRGCIGLAWDLRKPISLEVDAFGDNSSEGDTRRAKIQRYGEAMNKKLCELAKGRNKFYAGRDYCYPDRIIKRFTMYPAFIYAHPIGCDENEAKSGVIVIEREKKEKNSTKLEETLKSTINGFIEGSCSATKCILEIASYVKESY